MDYGDIEDVVFVVLHVAPHVTSMDELCLLDTYNSMLMIHLTSWSQGSGCGISDIRNHLQDVGVARCVTGQHLVEPFFTDDLKITSVALP